MNPVTMPSLPPFPIGGAPGGLSMGGVLPFILMLIYLTPTVVAVLNRAKSGGSIYLLNLFLGWTVIGWFAALYWAYSSACSKGACDTGTGAVTGAASAARPLGPVTTAAKTTGVIKNILIAGVAAAILIIIYAGYLALTIPRKEFTGPARKTQIEQPQLPEAKKGVPIPAEELFGK